jgi:RNA polymerase sigma-70 factor (ECF subfamily)
MTRNEADAEDLTQESFLSVFRKVGGFRGDSAFTTWLYRLVVNQVKMHFRYQSSRPEEQTKDGNTEEQAMAFPHRAHSVQLTDRLVLEEAVQSLPPGYRKVFILHDLEGYKHNESGRLLGHAAGTSKSQLHRARVRLRELLSDGPAALPVRLRCPTAR